MKNMTQENVKNTLAGKHFFNTFYRLFNDAMSGK